LDLSKGFLGGSPLSISAARKFCLAVSPPRLT
jgi:hypothetical protein